MTEATPPEVTVDPIALTSATMGHDFLAAMLAELRQMPDHWMRINADLQQKIIERLKEKIRTGIEKAVTIFMKGEFPAVTADLKGVTMGTNITASLSVRRDALCRHALFDAQGTQVLIIITDASRWTHRMDEIKTKGDQLDLWNGDYDPAQDQPGYRRDQDRFATGTTWADLKKSLGVSDAAPLAGETPSTEGEKPEVTPAPEQPSGEDAPPPDSSLGEQRESIVLLRIFQEELAQVGVGISLGAIQARTDDELHEAREWAAAYAADGDSCKIERPIWLPPPDRAQGPQP